ncbi:peptidylprolyl isomerase [Aeoliella mucimassa]|uniref:peptidylprolyl isomerase n=1 Tax=Aeoliella mucimassa TaxID=2527972 RepID=A0A518AK60_9BACT|nr:peptidylprolyl isomerase [Aeoliella mucimassa]QDU55120.1 Peptidyl-prolyl cis-trans isomerase B [Aeoliella mucimassa]
MVWQSRQKQQGLKAFFMQIGNALTKQPRRAAFILCLGLMAISASAESAIVRFSTSAGDIDVRLFESLAPNSVDNFMNYADTDRYEGTFIHRTPGNFVVQGGGFKMNANIFEATGIETDAPIPDEPGLSNLRGTLSFAKNSLGATSQWFFNLVNNSFLDSQGFTVFGRVVGDGMDVVDYIEDLDIINAAVAQDAAGEDFDEIPVFDVDKVVAQQNIFPEDAVMISSVELLPIPDGDYNFDGLVDDADYQIWVSTFGSTTDVRADGNGDGLVNLADYTVWRDHLGASSSLGGVTSVTVPEPASWVLALSLAAIWKLARAKKSGPRMSRTHADR